MVLSINQLSKSYGSTKAVDSINLSIEKGQIFGLLGPNGSGKTTTLAVILGIRRPNSGSYSWFDNGDKAENRRRLGSLLEKPNFCPWLNPEKNLKNVGLIRKIDDLGGEVSRCLKMVGLWEARNKKFSTFSLGMKQRLAFASANLGDPDVLVLDEPTNGVDAAGIIEIRNLISDIASRGKTIILASHNLDEVEKVCTHVAVLKQGKVLQSGAIREVLSKETSIEVAADDLNQLETILKSCDFVKAVSKEVVNNKDILSIQLENQKSPTDLNKFLVGQDVVLSHLLQKNKSLEAHFLELLDRS